MTSRINEERPCCNVGATSDSSETVRVTATNASVGVQRSLFSGQWRCQSHCQCRPTVVCDSRTYRIMSRWIMAAPVRQSLLYSTQLPSPLDSADGRLLPSTHDLSVSTQLCCHSTAGDGWFAATAAEPICAADMRVVGLVGIDLPPDTPLWQPIVKAVAGLLAPTSPTPSVLSASIRQRRLSCQDSL